MTDDELRRLLEANTERIEKRFDRVDKRLDGMDKRFDGIDLRFDGIDLRLDGIDLRLDGIDLRLDGVDKRLDGVDKRLEALDKKIDDTKAEMRLHFDATAEDLRGRLDLHAEGFANLNEKMDRVKADTDVRMALSFADTQAMIKFSHAELERRLRQLEQTAGTLEEKFASLQARIERLEEVKTTH